MTVINLQDWKEKVLQKETEELQKVPVKSNKTKLLDILGPEQRLVGIESAINNQALVIQELMQRIIHLEEKQLQLITYIRVMAESLDRAKLI